MTDTALELARAFKRHSTLDFALTDGIRHEIGPEHEELTFTLQGHHARALIRILDAAPRNGDPLNTRVNIVTDTDAWETDASKMNRYLEDNDWEPTLENVAAAFLYTETDLSQLDINLQGQEYRVTRIDAVDQYTGDGQGRGGGYTKIIATAPGTLTVTTKTDTIHRKDDKPEIITYVTLTANTSTAGAYYLAEILNQLSEENG